MRQPFDTRPVHRMRTTYSCSCSCSPQAKRRPGTPRRSRPPTFCHRSRVRPPFPLFPPRPRAIIIAALPPAIIAALGYPLPRRPTNVCPDPARGSPYLRFADARPWFRERRLGSVDAIFHLLQPAIFVSQPCQIFQDGEAEAEKGHPQGWADPGPGDWSTHCGVREQGPEPRAGRARHHVNNASDIVTETPFFLKSHRVRDCPRNNSNHDTVWTDRHQ